MSRQDVPEYFERLRIEGRGLKESFHLVNAEPSTVPWEGVDIKGLVIASDSDLQKFFQEKRTLEQNWKAFYRQYPNAPGLIGVSRVGFNSQATQAVVYIEIGCGPLCGNGFMAHLKRGLSGWKVEKIEHLWVS
ncbi:MAG: hypothetical protein ACJ8J7_05695 [Sulfurifustaceae bacterium]